VTIVMALLATIGLAAAGLSLIGPRTAQVSTVAAGVACLGLALSLVPTAGRRPIDLGFLRVDAVSEVFLLATAFLYAAAAAYSIGYLRGENDRYLRLFYAGLNIFAWSMLCAPLVDGLALLWVAIEITTVVSALLVAIDGTDLAAEAAWKYVLLASAGLGIGLMATILMYYAGASVFGQSYELAFTPLIDAGAKLPHTAVRLSFVLAVLGYGTKVGLFPVHTWLPDAHAEAPTPVSALLSGSLLVVSFYAVLRYYQIAGGALGPGFPRAVLLVFGVLSLLLAALYLLDQQGVKRLLAYSSIEHMGILCIGVSFGAPIAFAGVLLHVLAHAAAKGNAFFGAGVFVRKFKTKDISGIRGALDALPWSGPIFCCAILALSAMPPFGIFRSEFEIVSGGLSAGKNTAAVILVLLVTVAFFGLTLSGTQMLFLPGPVGSAVVRGEPSVWMVAPMVAGVVALLILGVHPPGDLTALLTRGAAELGVGG
jgi:hydrogenase-4 component F